MPFDMLSSAQPQSHLVPERHLNVRMPDGGLLSPRAFPGERVIDVLSRFGIPLRDQDAGASTVTTRAVIDERSFNSDALLGNLIVSPDVDDRIIELPWSALAPQTYWIAG